MNTISAIINGSVFPHVVGAAGPTALKCAARCGARTAQNGGTVLGHGVRSALNMVQPRSGVFTWPWHLSDLMHQMVGFKELN